MSTAAASILTHASEAELASAVDENLFDLFRSMALSLGGEIEESPHFCRHFTFPTNPMFKGVWQTRLPHEQTDEAIRATITWFEEREAPYFFWWIGTGDQPGDLSSHLQKHGLISMEEQMHELAPGIISTENGAPCMVAELEGMNEAALNTVPPGFTIQTIKNEQDLLEFKQVFVQSYEIPEFAGQAWVDATLHCGIGNSPWKMYLGRLNGEPVATNMLITGGGVAGVIAVGTIPSARGRGIGAAITLLPLLEARQMGYHYGALFATEMGISVYERIGFRLTGSRINRYMWRNPSGLG